jgi:capsular polysaccharide biosynthesis protein
MTARAPRRSARGSGLLRRSVILGAVLALLVLGGGGAYAATQHQTATAEAVLVVLPRADLDEATTAAFYETLSRGQIVGTFAEVANSTSFTTEAMDKLGLGSGDRTGVTSEVSVVPDTSVILVRTTAPRAAVAEQVADATARLSSAYLATLSDAFQTKIVHSAAGTASSSGLSPAVVLVLAGVVALTLGVALQQAAYHLGTARRLTAPDAVDRAPAPGPGPGSAGGPAPGPERNGQARDTEPAGAT